MSTFLGSTLVSEKILFGKTCLNPIKAMNANATIAKD